MIAEVVACYGIRQKHRLKKNLFSFSVGIIISVYNSVLQSKLLFAVLRVFFILIKCEVFGASKKSTMPLFNSSAV